MTMTMKMTIKADSKLVRTLSATLFACWVSSAAAQAAPDLSVDIGGSVLQMKPESLEEELVVGKLVASQLLGAAKLLRNPGLQKYVNLVGRLVAEQSGRKDLNWSFGVVDSTAVNAFASPGGYILVTSALIQLLDTEDELAAVLAHEVAHVERKHHYKVIRKQQMLKFGASAVAIGGEQGAMADKISEMVAQILARGLDKSAEYEADRDGMVYAARAGYDSSAMIRVMEKLSTNATKEEQSKLLLATHPSPNDRSVAMAKAVNADIEKAARLSPAASRFEQQQQQQSVTKN
jgi:predicted Zn-dependent protease